MKKKVFRKFVIDELRGSYQKHRAETWESDVKAHARYPQTRFNESDLFQLCRNMGGTRVQCAHAVDAAEADFQGKKYPLPVDPPFTDDFETAVKNHY